VNSCWPVEFTVLNSGRVAPQEEFCALTDAVVRRPDTVKSSDFGLLDVHVLAWNKCKALGDYSCRLARIHLYVFQCMWQSGTVLE